MTFIRACNRYGQYCVPALSRHRPAAQIILNGQVYEPDTIDLLRSIPGSIIHAGTYFGDFLPAIALSRRIYAFEPNPLNYRCARITCRINNLASVMLTHAALSDQAGTVSLKVWGNDGLALGGHSHITAIDNEQAISVPSIRLDDVIHEPITAIHLDVEYHEAQALAGARQLIERDHPLLVIETLPELQWLFALGYAVVDRVHANYVLAIR